ncbi:hypothetical protein KKE92_02690 [Candidatus Micrarchaeota archaeon]|nr:hypothetical protein [Candidatus Micrarchaeota archaeon]
MNSKNDLELANRVISEFVDEIIHAHPKEIEFIILTGSISRGDFVLGEGDFDLSIIMKKDEDVAKIKENAQRIFLKLDKRYKTRFVEADEKAKKHRLFSIFHKNQKNEYIAIRGPTKLKPTSIFQRIFSFLDHLVGYEISRIRHASISGKIVYGRYIIPDLIRYRSKLHPFRKLFTYDFFISIITSFLVFVSPDRALKRAFRCIIMAFEDVIIANEYHPVAMKTFNLRMKFDKVKKEWPYLDKIVFCIMAPYHIFFHNYKNTFSK